MKQILLGVFSFIVLFTQAQELKVMTYNVKLDYPKEGENSWANRKPFFINQLKFYEPDVFGVQEPMPNQMKDIDNLLTDYRFVGVGRDDGNDKGEYSAIFYKKDKLKVLESSTFWLSQTPEKVSMGWDAVCNRICTYALFEDIETSRKIWIFNTHFDHVGVEARKNSATFIIQRINEINVQNYPVILMGDFNMEESHESIQFILKNLNDSKVVSNMTFGPEGTYNGFHFDEPVTARIDYIFVSSNIKVKKYAVLSDSWNLKYPSDHLPVLIEIRIN